MSVWQTKMNMPTTTYNRPLWRTAWRRVARRPFQYVLFILGIAIGVAMMVAIDVASGSASRAFQLSTDAVVGKATHRIVADGVAGMDEAVYRDVRIQASYRLSAPVAEGYVIVNEFGEQPMRLLGIDTFAEPPFRDYLSTSSENSGLAGITPFLLQPNALIVSRPLAQSFGLALGDDITIDLSGQETTMQIVGLLEPRDGMSERALGNLMFTDIATAQEVLGMVGRLSHIDLIAEESDLPAIEAVLPENVRIEKASSQSNTVQQMTAAFNLNLSALSLLALIVGMFLIYNTVTFSVVQRRPLFGVLRCLGVTGAQLFRLILLESAMLALIGSLLGLGLGVLLGRGMVGLITQTINDFYFVVNVTNVEIPMWSLVKGLVLGVGAAVFASALPAYEAMQTSPLSTLRRSSLESRTEGLLPKLTLTWVVFSLAGAYLLTLRSSLIFSFAGLFVILIGAAFVTPALTAYMMRFVTPITQRLMGAVGRMAPRDIVRSLSRTSVAIAALMTAVSVVVGVSIMIGSFRQTVSQWLGDTLRADIFISPPQLTGSALAGTLEQDVVDYVYALPELENVVLARQVSVRLPELDRRVDLVANNGDVSNGQRRYAYLDGEMADVWQRYLAGEGVMVSETLLLRSDLPIPPEPITLATPDGEKRVPILAVYYDYSSDQGSVSMNMDMYEAWWDDPYSSSIALFLQDQEDIDEVATRIQREFAGRQDLLVQSNQKLRDEALNVFDRTFAITSALRLLAVVVAFIGVLSALMSLQLERTRELGILRATGMTIRQFWQLVLLETGLMGGMAGLIAMPVGYVLAWVLIYVINVRSFGWTLQMYLQWEYFLQALGVSLVAALLAGIYPTLLIGRMVIATAIRQE